MLRTRAALLLVGLLAAHSAWTRSYHEVAWPDECIYLVGARNVVERGSLDTHYYLTGSLLARGHPHRDVHMPGYVLMLAPFVGALGTTLQAASALNLALFLVSILLVHALARALLEDENAAVIAAALFAILPPFPGYLYTALPEIATACFFLAGMVWLVSGQGRGHAFGAGVLYACGALLRETLLVGLPLYLARIPRPHWLRGFAPGALLGFAFVVVPLARDRAIHPNAIYPGMIEEARRAPDPLGTVVAGLGRNVLQNLEDASEARPFQNAEDAVLLLTLLLALGTALAARAPASALRRAARATLVTLALLSAAVLALYVVRERGGVWGGVRAYMTFAPLLLIFVVSLLFRSRPPARELLSLALAGLLLALDARQLYAFLRYKSSDHEDQGRYSRYVASYVARESPRRILGRLFLYGLEHYPAEIIWSPPRDYRELRALEDALRFDYVVINDRSPLRLFLIRNPRYVRVNKDDRAAELLIWRRLH